MNPRPVHTFASFRLDVEERGLFQHGRSVALTPKAFDTLLVLVERHGRLVSKDELFRAVWPDAFVEENNLAQHISALRRVLAADPQAPVIETVPKRGYRFVGDVVAGERTEAEAPSVRVEAVLPEMPRGPAEAGTGLTVWRVWAWRAGLAMLAAIALVAMARRARLPEAPGDAAGVTRIAVLPFSNLGPRAMTPSSRG